MHNSYLKSLTFFFACILPPVLSIWELVLYVLGSSLPYSNLLRVHPGWDPFYDLRIFTLNGSNCPIAYQDISYINHCASKHYGFNYPKYILFILKQIPLPDDPTIPVGFLLGVTAVLLTSCLFIMPILLHKPINIVLLFGWQLIALNSFGFRWAVERGQVDLIIYCLLIAPFLFYLLFGGLSRVDSNCNSLLLGFCLLGLALSLSNILKIYTVFASILYIICCFPLIFGSFRIHGLYRFAVAVILCLIIASIVMAALYVKNAFSSELDPLSIGSSAFGFRVLTSKGLIAYITKLGGLFFGIVFAKLFMSTKEFDANKLTCNAFKVLLSSYGLFAFSACILLPLYFFSVNLNYKLLFLVPVLWSVISFWQFRSYQKSWSAMVFLYLILSCIIYPYRPASSPLFYSKLELYMHLFAHPVFYGMLLFQFIAYSRCAWSLFSSRLRMLSLAAIS